MQSNNYLESIFSLKNKTAIITGGSEGTGAEIARAFIKAGANVACISRSESVIKEGVDDRLQNVKLVTYSVVKTGLIGLTRYLATYWADKNVRCNAMCPGGVENGQPDDYLEEVNKRITMGRMASSDEYQGTLLWMLSDASSYLNGVIVPVEGGSNRLVV
jgi:NAD(P)-dependent dehydrogenase (short-subunit alcohol dehydrogenase family)